MRSDLGTSLRLVTLSLCVAVAGMGILAPVANASTYMTVWANAAPDNTYLKSIEVRDTPHGSFCRDGSGIITNFPKKAGSYIVVAGYSSDDCRSGTGLASQWVKIPATVDKVIVTIHAARATWVRG